MKRPVWLAIASLVFFALTALVYVRSTQAQGKPHNISKSDEYTRAGGSSWGHAHSVTTGVTYVSTATGAASASNHAHLFKWGELATVCCTAAVDFMWSQDWDDITIVSGANAGWLEDAAGEDGIGPAFHVPAGLCVDQVPWRGAFLDSASPGRRDNICSGTDLESGWPCEDAGDCVYSGASCDSTSSWQQTAGAFLLAIGGASTTCNVRVDR